MNTLENYLKTHDGGHLLDIACGGGAFTKRLISGLKSYQKKVAHTLDHFTITTDCMTQTGRRFDNCRMHTPICLEMQYG